MNIKLNHSLKVNLSPLKRHKLKLLNICLPYSALELIHLLISNEYLVKFFK